MGLIIAVIVIGLLVIIGMVVYQASGWGAVIGVFIGGAALLWLILWLYRDRLIKAGLNSQQKESRKIHAAETWIRASQRNIKVKCKSCGKRVAELSTVCSECGESLPGLHIQCPECASEHVTLARKGFSVGQAAAGGILIGTVGLVAGMIGSKDYEFVCLGCNHKWGLPVLKK